MALKLVDEMTEKWKPEAFSDTYRDDLMKRIEQKVKAGQTHTLTEPEEEVDRARRGRRRQGRGPHVAAGAQPGQKGGVERTAPRAPPSANTAPRGGARPTRAPRAAPDAWRTRDIAVANIAALHSRG